MTFLLMYIIFISEFACSLLGLSGLPPGISGFLFQPKDMYAAVYCYMYVDPMTDSLQLGSALHRPISEFLRFTFRLFTFLWMQFLPFLVNYKAEVLVQKECTD